MYFGIAHGRDPWVGCCFSRIHAYRIDTVSAKALMGQNTQRESEHDSRQESVRDSQGLWLIHNDSALTARNEVALFHDKVTHEHLPHVYGMNEFIAVFLPVAPQAWIALVAVRALGPLASTFFLSRASVMDELQRKFELMFHTITQADSLRI